MGTRSVTGVLKRQDTRTLTDALERIYTSPVCCAGCPGDWTYGDQGMAVTG